MVQSYNVSNDRGYISHFKAGGHSVRRSYPWVKGSFFGDESFGIDWNDLVVVVDGTCGGSCIVHTIEALLTHNLDYLREKQTNILKVVRLFSIGMGPNSLQHADAVASLLAQARHYAMVTEKRS